MRTLLFLGVLAGFATAGYVLAPRLIEDNYRPSEAGEPQVAASQTGVAMATPSPMQSSVSEITRQMPEAPKAQIKAKSAKKDKASKKRKHRRGDSAMIDSPGGSDALDRVPSEEVAQVTGLRPLNGEVRAAQEEGQKPKFAGRVEGPKSRWIDDLSGPKVRFEMGKKSVNDGCAYEYSNCERPAAPKDISVAGVVVKTERLAKDPKHPLDGKVKQGHYIESTPAVYVE